MACIFKNILDNIPRLRSEYSRIFSPFISFSSFIKVKVNLIFVEQKCRSEQRADLFPGCLGQTECQIARSPDSLPLSYVALPPTHKHVWIYSFSCWYGYSIVQYLPNFRLFTHLTQSHIHLLYFFYPFVILFLHILFYLSVYPSTLSFSLVRFLYSSTLPYFLFIFHSIPFFVYPSIHPRIRHQTIPNFTRFFRLYFLVFIFHSIHHF